MGKVSKLNQLLVEMCHDKAAYSATECPLETTGSRGVPCSTLQRPAGHATHHYALDEVGEAEQGGLITTAVCTSHQTGFALPPQCRQPPLHPSECKHH